MGAAAPAATAAAWAKCFAAAAQQEDVSELQDLIPILAALPAHERGGNVVTLLRRSLKDLELGFALGAWRLLNKARHSSTGTWETLSFTQRELDSLLATLLAAKDVALREVLLEMLEHSAQRLPLKPLASLWTKATAAPVTPWRVHRLACRARGARRAEGWQQAKESAYFQQHQLPLVDPRSCSLRALQLKDLMELMRSHSTYLQEPAFNEQSQCHLRPSCWEFYWKILEPNGIQGRSFAEIYLPQEAHVVVSHCWSEAFEDFFLALERHALHWRAAAKPPGGYWLGLLSIPSPGDHRSASVADVAVALETTRQLVMVWDAQGRWPTRLWCLYELLLAQQRHCCIQVTTCSGVLGIHPATAERARQVGCRLISSDPRSALGGDELRELRLGEGGFEAMDRALLAAAGPLLGGGATAATAAAETERFRQLVEDLCRSPALCLFISAPWGHRGDRLAAALLQRAAGASALPLPALPLRLPCGELAQMMEEKGVTGSSDLLQLWFQHFLRDKPDQPDQALAAAMAKYRQLVLWLEGFEDAGRHASSILTWVQQCLAAQRDVRMIITSAEATQRWTGQQLAQMDPLMLDLVQLSQCECSVSLGGSSLWPSLRSSLGANVQRVCITVNQDGRLLAERASASLASPADLGRHEFLELAETEAPNAAQNATCFEVYDAMVSKLHLPPSVDLELQELALKMQTAGAYCRSSSASSSLLSSSLLHFTGSSLSFASPALRGFFAAKALRRRNDLPPQVMSKQWPRVRHFLRRSLEAAVGETEKPVLRQRLKLARHLNCDCTAVLMPLLDRGERVELVLEALNAWLALAVEEDSEALAPLVSLVSKLPADAARNLEAKSLQMARAMVRLQDLDLSLAGATELLVTLEAVAQSGIAPERKWPVAQRFLEKIKGRITSPEHVQLLIRLVRAARLPESQLQESFEEFLASSLPCDLAVASSLLAASPCAVLREDCERQLLRWQKGWLPERRMSAGRYHSLLLSGGRAIALGLNDQGETGPLPALPPETRYVAVAAGCQHTLLLRSDGIVKATGLKLDGQLEVPALEQPIVAIAAGGFHSVVLDALGHATAFGCNAHGQCDVPHHRTVRIFCGLRHTLCLAADGGAVACGENGQGQCDVPDLFRDANATFRLKYITGAAGARHTVLLRNDGQAVAFGCNFYGQCDVPRRGLRDRHVAVACGEGHTVLLDAQGQVVALGDGRHGQCQVPGLPGTLRYLAVACGARHTLLLRSDGRVLAFGEDGEGQCQIPVGLLLDDS